MLCAGGAFRNGNRAENTALRILRRIGPTLEEQVEAYPIENVSLFGGVLMRVRAIGICRSKK